MAAETILTQVTPIGNYIRDNLMNGKRFVIPKYQRSYSWTKEDCEVLFQDVENYMEKSMADNGGNDPYFFGSLILDLSSSSGVNASNEVKIIDGQQRTITFILLFKALWLRLRETLDRMTNDANVEAHKFDLESDACKIFDAFHRTAAVDARNSVLDRWEEFDPNSILESLSRTETVKCKSDLREIMKLRPEGVSTWISAKQKKESNVRSNFKFFYDALKDERFESTHLHGFAITVFEKCRVIQIQTLNDDQAIVMFNTLNATGVPLTASDIVAATLAERLQRKEDEEKFDNTWNRLEELVRDNGELFRDGVDTVLQQKMYIELARNKDTDAQKRSVQKFFCREQKGLLETPLEFCASVLKIAERWAEAAKIPAVQVLLRFNVNARYFLASFLNRYDDPSIIARKKSDVAKVSECLIRLFSFVALEQGTYSSKEIKQFLLGENIHLADPACNIRDIQAHFKCQIGNNWEQKEIKQALVESSKESNAPLVYLNEYLYGKSKGFDLSTVSVNIEHILPDSGKNLPLIREFTKLTNDDEFEEYVNKLGNKILLEEGINKAIKNEWFGTKQKPTNLKKGYNGSKFALAKSLSQYHKDGPSAHVWEKDDINKATEKAATRIADFIFGKSRAVRKRKKA